jgi:SAM-dependent methyltransferase
MPHDSYESRIAQERDHYDRVEKFDELPPIYHYWSHTYVRPMLEEIGCSNPVDFFALYFKESAERCGEGEPVFASIGSGDCGNEIQIARLLRESGLERFTIECVEMNPALVARSREAVAGSGLAGQIVVNTGDFNEWSPAKSFAGIMANQSLHHVLNLESLFDAVRKALLPGSYFLTSDMIGRNGHQRWPEARRFVERFWNELPSAYRYNTQLNRREDEFLDWDCSVEGFEGIRSQDILPLLLERFDFRAFIGFGNVVDPFVDRAFGPNFNAEQPWDREFIDRVHALDEQELVKGTITPTHMVAILRAEPGSVHHFGRGLSPQQAVRR